MARAIRNRQVSFESIAETYADPRDPFDDIERALDGETEQEANRRRREAEIAAFFEALPPSTRKALREVLEAGETVKPSELARRIGIRRETLYKNLRRASRKVWGTDTPPFPRGGSGCA